MCFVVSILLAADKVVVVEIIDCVAGVLAVYVIALIAQCAGIQ